MAERWSKAILNNPQLGCKEAIGHENALATVRVSCMTALQLAREERSSFPVHRQIVHLLLQRQSCRVSFLKPHTSASLAIPDMPQLHGSVSA
jgi:hypothetical protein